MEKITKQAGPILAPRYFDGKFEYNWSGKDWTYLLSARRHPHIRTIHDG